MKAVNSIWNRVRQALGIATFIHSLSRQVNAHGVPGIARIAKNPATGPVLVELFFQGEETDNT